MKIKECAERALKSDIQWVLDYFSPRGEDEILYEMNWLFIGTSGIHGSCFPCLDEIEEYWVWNGKKWITKDEEKTGEYPELTILIVCPNLCCLYYGGEIEIENPEQIERLKEICINSINGILKSQAGNLGASDRTQWTQYFQDLCVLKKKDT